ncbi:MAG: type II toxin-antitoxin system RelE/ParE family toxin [Candidatus Aminicenantes bacterium]|nr:type II toxin-antitoxin system RelE/ParE family toxin [Candidatus Aminicenantes bacterium]
MINWTNEAETWLRDIYNYIAQDNPDAARRVVEGIYNKAQVLNDFPEIGYKYRSEPEGDIRIWLYGHYRIAYLIKEDNNIDIIGVFHGSLDIDRYLP